MTKSAQHYILTDADGKTVTVDKIGAYAGIAAYVRMMDRMAATAGVERLRCSDTTGARFVGGFILEGPFEKLGNS